MSKTRRSLFGLFAYAAPVRRLMAFGDRGAGTRGWMTVLLVTAVAFPSLVAGQSPKVVEVKDGQTYRWVPGMIAILKDDCWDRRKPPEKYLTGKDGTPCYRSLEDSAGSDWLFDNSHVATVAVENGCEERFEVPRPGRMEWTVSYIFGYSYLSPNPLMCEWLGRYVETKVEKRSAIFIGDETPCKRPIEVTAVEGPATASGREIEVGQEIGFATVLSTGANGSLEVTLPDKSVVRLGPNSHVKIGCDDRPEGEFKLNLSLRLGGLWAKITSATRDKMEVQTTRMLVGARGTIFEVDAGKSEDRVLVQEGKVAVRALQGGQQLILGPCQAASVTSPSSVRSIPPYKSKFITNCAPAAPK